MSVLRKTKLDRKTFDCTNQENICTTGYKVRSSALKLTGSVLLYNDGKQTHSFDFAELYLPATGARPVVTRLSDYPQHIDTLLAAADVRIDRSKEGLPQGRSLSRQFYLIRNILDWLQTRGIYRLKDASEADTHELVTQLAQGGWTYALSLESRWNRVLDQFETEEIDPLNVFHFRRESTGLYIETLQQRFWRKRLGWGGILPLTASAKARLEQYASNWPVSSGWANRQISDDEAPSSYVLRNIMGWLNDLATLPESVDRLQHRGTNSTSSSSKRIAKKASSRTANLQVDVAITLIGTALKLLYEISPLLLDIYENARTAYPNLSISKRQDWLYRSETRERLEILLGKPITNWTWSGASRRKPTCYAMDEILAAVQGACAIVLAAMNARRQGEICDRNRGVRVGDLIVLDKSLGLYQCWFYIEKTYRDRHLFYINQASADALQCLAKLKYACNPFDRNVMTEPSLFECGRFTERAIHVGAHFSFSEDAGRTRSLTSFLKVAYDNSDEAPAIASHMFRRFYAILYYHRYEHAELRALKQHLRHLDVAMTRVYVTDPSIRPLTEQISATLGTTNYHSVSQRLKDSLESEAADNQNALEVIGKEKLKMAIDEILNGEPTAGGFSKIVRKLYRQMLPRLSLDGKANDTVKDMVMGLLDSHGYSVKPMLHGQCHAPHVRRNLKAACERDGILARAHASPGVCGSCPFHFNNVAYLENLKEQLTALVADVDDFMLSPQQQARAQFDHQNLNRLITLTEKQMTINAETIVELSRREKRFNA